MESTDNSNENKWAVITGANRGIGLTVSEKFVKSGWNVCVCIRNESKEIRNLLGEHNGKIYYLDLFDEVSVKECGKNILKDIPSINALVNCAGAPFGALCSMTKMVDLKNIFQINFFSQVLFTQIISKKMIRKKEGAIVNVASISGIIAERGTLAYGCSKAALSHATRILSKELGIFNIRVNAVAPAYVDTDMGNLMDDKSKENLNTLGSINGEITSYDVAELIYYLCSDVSKYLSGQVIRLDKGMPF